MGSTERQSLEKQIESLQKRISEIEADNAVKASGLCRMIETQGGRIGELEALVCQMNTNS